MGTHNRKAQYSLDWIRGTGICQEGKGGRAFWTETNQPGAFFTMLEQLKGRDWF